MIFFFISERVSISSSVARGAGISRNPGGGGRGGMDRGVELGCVWWGGGGMSRNPQQKGRGVGEEGVEKCSARTPISHISKYFF